MILVKVFEFIVHVDWSLHSGFDNKGGIRCKTIRRIIRRTPPLLANLGIIHLDLIHTPTREYQRNAYRGENDENEEKGKNDPMRRENGLPGGERLLGEGVGTRALRGGGWGHSFVCEGWGRDGE